MKKFKFLDKEEKELIRDIEKYGKPAKNSKELMKQAVLMARAGIKYRKDKTVTIRISNDVLTKIKTKAGHQGVPYQTLLGSLIYQYADNRIKLNVL